MANISKCPICDSNSTTNSKLYQNCQEQYENFHWTLTCNCDTDSDMFICRDCTIDSEIKEKWLSLTSELNT